VFKRISIIFSTIIIAFTLYFFYLILSFSVSFISITSGQAYGRFDEHAKNLEVKSKIILSELNHFKFIRNYNDNTKIVFENQNSITKLLNVTPYVLGYKDDFKILFCTEYSFNSKNKLVSFASIGFKNSIPFEIYRKDSLRINRADCNSALLEAQSINGSNRSRNYDAFIWISKNLIQNIKVDIAKTNFDENSKSAQSFEEFILNNWKVENLDKSLINSFLVDALNADLKIRFSDRELDRVLDTTKLQLDSSPE